MCSWSSIDRQGKQAEIGKRTFSSTVKIHAFEIYKFFRFTDFTNHELESN